MNGIIAINKPQNFTSFDIIAILRKKFNQKKIGHMGTLDPMATGVLPVLLGSSAKFQVFTPETEKEYICEIHFGILTDTWDIWGKILNNKNSNLKNQDLENALFQFRGNLKQIPPMYSAIKKNGVKLCDLARRGKEIEREPRDVCIKSLQLIEFNERSQIGKLKILCSKGTYIRSLCHDIGKKLGTEATMGNLCRTLSNSFKISETISPDKINQLELEEIIEKFVFPTYRLFENNNSVNITTLQSKVFKNGGNLMLSHLKFDVNPNDNDIIKLYSESNFMGIGKVDIQHQVLKFLKCEN